VLHPAVSYGSLPRHKVDIYVPCRVYQQQQQQQRYGTGGDVQQRQQQQQQQQQEQPVLLPVVFFVHGGVWVTGNVTTGSGSRVYRGWV
jgi:acetyl esterase/lipase